MDKYIKVVDLIEVINEIEEKIKHDKKLDIGVQAHTIGTLEILKNKVKE